MTREIQVIIEGYGNRSLARNFAPADLQGKRIEEVVSSVLGQQWEGSDRVTYTSLMRKVNSSGSYTPHVEVPMGDRPASFAPARREDGISAFLKRYEGSEKPVEVLRIAITPAHKVGIY